MLQRMYSRWGERHGIKVELIDYHSGEQAGIKSSTLLVKGENAYGNLKAESGVHRLVRISPYDANARRHTSFSSVWVYPEVDDDIDIQINEFGAQDRHLSRVRRRRAACQHDRQRGADHPLSDRHRRRLPERAIAAQEPRVGDEAAQGAALRSRAAEARSRGRAANAAKTDIGWGHQIRSYVLQPYQLVKDLRTGVTSTAPERRARRRSRPLHGRGSVAARDRRNR